MSSDFNQTLIYQWQTVLSTTAHICFLVRKHSAVVVLLYQTLQSDWIEDGHGQRLMPIHFKVKKPSTGFSDYVKCDTAKCARLSLLLS